MTALTTTRQDRPRAAGRIRRQRRRGGRHPVGRWSSPTSPRRPLGRGHRLAVQALVAAIQTGKVSGAVDPVAGVPRQRRGQQGRRQPVHRGVAGLIVPDNDQDILQGAHVELRDISKSFGGTRALEGVSLTIARGSIHALVGENGAGKSTLGKIIAGAHAPDDGQVLLDGEPVRFHSPRDAINAGVILIAQELSIVRIAHRRAERVPRRRAAPGRLPEPSRAAPPVQRAGRLGRLRARRRRQRRDAADGRPAEGRDPPRAVPQRRADRDGRADGRAVRPDVEALHAVIRQLAQRTAPRSCSSRTSWARCSSSPTR